MTKYSRGEVVTIDMTFTNQAGTKPRPALVVSVDRYCPTHHDVIIASITGHVAGVGHEGDYLLQDWQQAGLKMSSKVQTKLVTIEEGLITGRCGNLTLRDLAGVEAGLRQALGL